MLITPLIHITAAYSNAVLIAILPHVSNFAKKLDLPIPQPITASQVAHFNANPMKGFIGGGVWLTNHYVFAYDNGCIHSFRSLDDNAFYDQDPTKNWPSYAFGKDNMTTNQAIELARDTLRKLGYDPKLLHAEDSPSLMQGPFDTNDGHHIPYCEIRWESPEEMDSLGHNVSDYLEFQINMEKKTVVGMSIASRKIWGPDPKIDVEPELESDYKKRIQGKMFVRTNVPSHYPQPTNMAATSTNVIVN